MKDETSVTGVIALKGLCPFNSLAGSFDPICEGEAKQQIANCKLTNTFGEN